MRRNEIAKLPKNAEFGYGWFGVSFFHLCRVTELKNHSNHFFLCFNQDSYGMAVKWIEASIESSELPQKRLERRFTQPALLRTRRILERLQTVQN